MIRIVKMHFRPDTVDRFEELFKQVYPRISTFPGCRGVRLLKDIRHGEIYFTYSTWDSPQDLENYRQSDLFKTTWANTKPLFGQPAEAWSVDEVNPEHIMPKTYMV